MNIQNQQKNLYLSLLNVDECHVTDWNFQNVISPFTRLYLVKNGEGTIIFKNKKYELKPGTLFMIPSFTCCNYSSKTFFEHFYVHIIPQFAGGTDIFKMFGFKYESQATEADYILMKRILKLNPGRKLTHWNPQKYSKEDFIPRNLSIQSADKFATEMETQGILLQLFSRFLQTQNSEKTKTIQSPDSAMTNVISYIQRNIDKPIKIRELSELCNLSDDYFSRLFLKTMGIRPLEYINRKRIENAQLKLVTTNDSIEKIALDVGIDNFSYFNRLFKRYSCLTPGKYRLLHRLV